MTPPAYPIKIKSEPKMIYIVIALFTITLAVLRPRKKLSLRETTILFIIYLCVGLTVRTIIFMFGM